MFYDFYPFKNQKSFFAMTGHVIYDKLDKNKESKNQLEKEIDQLEKDLSSKSSYFKSSQSKTVVNWRNIQEKLGENEYALEIIRYRYFDNDFTDSVIYVGLLIDKKTL